MRWPWVHALAKEQRNEAAGFLGKTLHWNDLRMALCFKPRHGMRLTSGKQTLDFLICFECDRVRMFDGEKQLGELPMGFTDQKNPIEKLLADGRVGLSGTVFLSGNPARRFLVALEDDTLELLRDDKRRASILISSTIGSNGPTCGAGPILGVSLLHPPNVDEAFKWHIDKNKLTPEYIVVKRHQPITIIDLEPGPRRDFQYSSKKQRMPAPFTAFPSQDQTFVFHRAEIGIVFYNVARPHMFGYVSVLDHGNFSFTDSSGRFAIGADIPRGKYSLRINHPRHGSWVRRIELPSNQALEIKLSLDDVDKTRSSIWSDRPPVPWTSQ